MTTWILFIYFLLNSGATFTGPQYVAIQTSFNAGVAATPQLMPPVTTKAPETPICYGEPVLVVKPVRVASKVKERVVRGGKAL